MLALALVGLTKDLRELLEPPEKPLVELGLNEATPPADERRGALNRRLDDSEDFTAVALIVGMISVGVMIAGPFVELFLFGLNEGRDLELPNGRITGVNPFFFEGTSISYRHRRHRPSPNR